MMPKGLYGLAYNPFCKQADPQKVSFQSNDFQEMTNRLNFIKDARGIGLFTSPPGFGKTFAMRCFANSLNPNLYQMAYICLSTVSLREFYRQFCVALNLEPSVHRSTMFRLIQERLYVLFKDKRRPFILALDEAQEIDSRVLKDIKMIMNHDYDSLNCFTLLLIGEPHLNQTLAKPVHEALAQRITIHYNFSGLSADETHKYINHKISAAGGCPGILADAAACAVHGFSNGNPRIIDNVMSDAFDIGEQAGKKTIDTDIILSAVENQSFQ